jgi:hypothetical protein
MRMTICRAHHSPLHASRGYCAPCRTLPSFQCRGVQGTVVLDLLPKASSAQLLSPRVPQARLVRQIVLPHGLLPRNNPTPNFGTICHSHSAVQSKNMAAGPLREGTTYTRELPEDGHDESHNKKLLPMYVCTDNQPQGHPGRFLKQDPSRTRGRRLSSAGTYWRLRRRRAVAVKPRGSERRRACHELRSAPKRAVTNSLLNLQWTRSCRYAEANQKIQPQGNGVKGSLAYE